MFMRTEKFSVILHIIMPEILQEITFSSFLAKEKTYFAPAPSEIIEIFKFQKRLRKPGETIADFLNDLKEISEL